MLFLQMRIGRVQRANALFAILNLDLTPNLVRMPVESALFIFNVHGNGNGDQGGTTSLHAAASLVTNKRQSLKTNTFVLI